MRTWFLILLAFLMVTVSACSNSAPKQQAVNADIPKICQDAKAKSTKPTSVKLLSSIYVGWMPNQYANETGVFKKWGDRCNVNISFAMATDYISSIEAYVAGQADGVTMTNMEALNMAAAAGVDTTAVVNGDTSHGNDAVISRTVTDICALKGKKAFLVQFSVSHYLLARGLQDKCAGMKDSDLNLVNMSDSDIGPAFLANRDMDTVVTWNPIVLNILDQEPKAKDIFNSSQIPGEIIDTFYVRTELLQAHPEVGVALAGAWYEIMGIMTSQDAAAKDKALKRMADASGDTLESYKKQLETTRMFWTPQEAVGFTKNPDLVRTMEFVRTFSFQQGLLGQNVKSADQIGIQFSDGNVKGDPKNIKLRFTSKYIEAVQ